ncbi:hypothetical protein D3C77_635540 [compost metagenome]
MKYSTFYIDRDTRYRIEQEDPPTPIPPIGSTIFINGEPFVLDSVEQRVYHEQGTVLACDTHLNVSRIK